jgi:hypothetical protein
MRKQRVLLAAVCGVGIGGFGLMATAQDTATRTPGATPGAAQRDTARTTGDIQATDANAIRQVLREVTNAALTKDGFDDIIERFTEADRNRLGKDEFTDQDHEVLDGRIAQLQKDWQEKYNAEFNLANFNTVYGPTFARISQQPGATLAGERRAPTGEQQAPAGSPNEVQRRTDTPGNPEGTQRRTDGRADTGAGARADTGDAATGGDDAYVTFAASHGLPEVRVPMRREAMGRWKIDIPDNYSSRQFHDNLLKHLTFFGQQKSQWPENQDQAYQMASHYVLMAISNTEASGAGGMRDGNQPGMQPGQGQQRQPGQPGYQPQPGQNPQGQQGAQP